jgi:hypothetical protein
LPPDFFLRSDLAMGRATPFERMEIRPADADFLRKTG